VRKNKSSTIVTLVNIVCLSSIMNFVPLNLPIPSLPFMMLPPPMVPSMVPLMLPLRVPSMVLPPPKVPSMLPMLPLRVSLPSILLIIA
jgi:hypothetical protein